MWSHAELLAKRSSGSLEVLVMGKFHPVISFLWLWKLTVIKIILNKKDANWRGQMIVEVLILRNHGQSRNLDLMV